MFSPTSFPAQAWRVTKALNVVPVVLNEKYRGRYELFTNDDYTAFSPEELFPDRTAAVEHAVARLADDEARVARAIDRHARRRAMVRKVLAGGSK